MMSEGTLGSTCDITLTGALQLELETVARADTEVMNKEQLQKHISNINNGLTAIAQLPTTSRLMVHQRAKQSVRDAEAQISELMKDKENQGQICRLSQ
jgi:hypothetical protein